MPETTNKTYGKNPFAVPEPYYLPGYTGHCPNYSRIIGQTYGRATHSVMEGLTALPRRLKPLPDEGQWQQPEQKDLDKEDIEILKERNTGGVVLLKENIAPGYKGHIPSARWFIGLDFNKCCIKGVAEFERRRRELQELLRKETEAGGEQTNSQQQ